MKYEFVTKGYTVFFAGDNCHKNGNFYIIMDGAVNVFIPKKQ